MNGREKPSSRPNKNSVECQGCYRQVPHHTTHFWPRVLIGIVVCKGPTCTALYADNMMRMDAPAVKRKK